MPIQKRPPGSGKNGNTSDDEKLTPLQRYLAKQKAAELKQQQATKSGLGKGQGNVLNNALDNAPNSVPKSSTETRKNRFFSALGEKASTDRSNEESKPTPESSAGSPAAGPGSFGLPPSPPPPEKPPAESVSEPSEILREPGAFLARFAAYLVDLVILAAAAKGIDRFFFGPLRWFGGPDIFGFEDSLNFILYHVLAFFYYGWFYSQKGASPGKIILQLEVGDAHSQARLGYWRAFLRESIGKYISTVPFLLGFLLAGLRRDHRALHDLIFDTQVVRKKT